MRSARYTLFVLAVAVGAAACDRTRQGAEEDAAAARDEAAEELQQRQDDMVKLEQRVADLDREWNEAQQRLEKRTDAATVEAKQEMQEGIAEVREEIAQLRNINADNWWARYEAELDQEATELEADVKRFARNWNPARDTDEVGTTGDSWEARRDRLVSRVEQRISSWEEALKNDTTRRTDADNRAMEYTRTRIAALRQDAERLKNTAEEDWWEPTRDRVNEAIDRLEASIERLGNDGSSTN